MNLKGIDKKGIDGKGNYGDFSTWKEVVAVWLKQFGGNERCAVCNSVLHSGNFPDDFPKEWMWCCSCLTVGEMLVEKSIEEMKDIFHTSNRTLRRIEGVIKIINVN